MPEPETEDIALESFGTGAIVYTLGNAGVAMLLEDDHPAMEFWTMGHALGMVPQVISVLVAEGLVKWRKMKKEMWFCTCTYEV